MDNTQWNLWTHTQDFADDDVWLNRGVWKQDSETYQGFTVMKRDGSWWGIGKTLSMHTGSYTLSFYAKASAECTGYVYLQSSDKSISKRVATVPVTTEWQRFAATATIESDDSYSLRFEKGVSNITLYVCGMKLEEGTAATPWCGTFEEEREKAIAARGGTYSSRLTLTALCTGSPGYITRPAPEFFISDINVPYINLQWNRSLYKAGTFSVQLKTDDYNEQWSAFCVTLPDERLGGEHVPDYYYVDGKGHGRICTATGHYEVGLIYKTEFTVKNGSSYVILSGLMMDSILDGWVTLTGQYSETKTMEEGFLNACETGIGVYLYNENLTETWSTDEDRAAAPLLTTKDYTPSYNTCLVGDHFRTLLAKRGFGIACAPYWQSYKTNNRTASLYFMKAGVNRAIGSSSPVMLGVKFGNATSEVTTVDDSAYKRGIAGRVTYKETDIAGRIWEDLDPPISVTLPHFWHRGALMDNRTMSPNGDQTLEEVLAEAKADGWVTLHDYEEETTVELDVSLLPIETFISLGLGDTVTVHLAALDKLSTMRVTGFSEVCKGSSYTRTVTLGTKALTKEERAAKYAVITNS